MLSKTYGGAVYGVNASMITIEVAVSQGLHFFMVGLPDSAVKESQQRVEASLKHIGYRMPRQKIVVNLAPADVKKEGSSYDLPIALCVLETSEQIKCERSLEEYVIMGELSLDGQLRPIKGVLPIAIEARKQGMKGFILPTENAPEAAIVNNLDIIGVDTIQEAVEFVEGKRDIEPLVIDTPRYFCHTVNDYEADFSHVQGQENIKRALGNHGGGRPQRHHDWSARRGAKPCWPSDCRPFCRRFLCRKRWKPPKSIPWPGSSDRAPTPHFAAAVSLAGTTPSARRRWSAAVVFRNRARFRWPTTAYFSWDELPEFKRSVLK